MKDHQTNDDIIERAFPALQKAGVRLTSTQDRELFCTEYRKLKLSTVAKTLEGHGYELISETQAPEKDCMLATWLIKNQTKALATEEMTFLDFRAPIEIQALMLSDNVM